MFIAMNRFKVVKGEEEAFETVWSSRKTRLDEMQADAETPQTFQRRIDILAGVIKAETPPPPAPNAPTPAK